MSRRAIVIWEALKDIGTGIDAQTLREKYGLSEEGLKSLHRQLSEAGFVEKIGERYVLTKKRIIRTKEIVKDILSGLTRAELMQKYTLSSRKLQKVFTKLINAGEITPDDLSHRDLSFRDPVQLVENRGFVRAYPIFPPVIYEKDKPQQTGRIKDLSEDGVGVRGLFARVDEVKTLAVVPDEMMEIEPFSFSGKCRWVKRGYDRKMSNAGFEIVFISGTDLGQFRKLIQLTTLLF